MEAEGLPTLDASTSNKGGGVKIETLQIKDWTIRGRVDESGHLLITIFHNDGSRVIKTEGLLGLPAGTDKVWGRILTTQKIEEDYRGGRHLA